MNDLKDLIGQEVVATIGEDDDLNDVSIRAKVIHVDIDYFYFYSEGMPIYITVDVEALEDLPEGYDYEDLQDIALNDIRKR